MYIGSLFLLAQFVSPILGREVKSRAQLSLHGLVVQTTSGELHGFINQTAPSVRQFLGIPYAEPPTKDRRFLPPVAKQYAGSLQTRAFAPSCMQLSSNSSSIYTEEVPEFLIEGGQSEDCLYLNVWTPARESAEKLPVFFYIPGGAFTSGGANSLYKIPDKWIERTQSHIVVALNYRVNIFGFPNAKGLENQNLGLLDQRLAIEWTRDNIAAFGGDPSRITLWGQSAGGVSVDTYGYSYPKDPIVSSLICDSGVAGILNNADSAQTNFTFIAGLVGCGGNKDEHAILSCMRQMPAANIENALSNYSNSGKKPSVSFTIVVDNKTVFSNTTDRAVRGLVANIPAIIGSNANEGAAFAPFSLSGPSEAIIKSITDSLFLCPIAKEVRIRETVGLRTYRYFYTGNFSNISPLPWMGAYHSSELPLLFGTHYLYNTPSTSLEWDLSFAMEALWLSFASNPSAAPTYKAKSGETWSWPEFQAKKLSTVQFPDGNEILKAIDASILDQDCTNI